MNFRSAHKWTAVGATLLGLGHCALASMAPKLSLDVLWFVGTGLGFIILAAANLMLTQSDSRNQFAVLAGLNALMTLFFAFAWALLPQPQVIVGGLLFGLMTALAIATGRSLNQQTLAQA